MHVYKIRRWTENGGPQTRLVSTPELAAALMLKWTCTDNRAIIDETKVVERIKKLSTRRENSFQMYGGSEPRVTKLLVLETEKGALR